MIVSEPDWLYRPSPRVEQNIRLNIDMLDLSWEPAQLLLDTVDKISRAVTEQVMAMHPSMRTDGKAFLEIAFVQPMRHATPAENPVDPVVLRALLNDPRADP